MIHQRVSLIVPFNNLPLFFFSGDEETVCNKIIEILLPFAHEWDSLSRALNFPDDMRTNIAKANASDQTKLAVMIREWWRLDIGQDKFNILCGVLFHGLKEEELARQVLRRNN